MFEKFLYYIRTHKKFRSLIYPVKVQKLTKTFINKPYNQFKLKDYNTICFFVLLYYFDLQCTFTHVLWLGWDEWNDRWRKVKSLPGINPETTWSRRQHANQHPICCSAKFLLTHWIINYFLRTTGCLLVRERSLIWWK